MSSPDVSSEASTPVPEAGTLDMKLEVVEIGVSDVDRAKAFYLKLGFRLDADFVAGDDFRVAESWATMAACGDERSPRCSTAKPSMASSGC